MEPKIIHRNNHTEELILEPTIEEGVFVGVVRNHDDETTSDKAGNGILIPGVHYEILQKIKNDPTYEIDGLVRPLLGKAGGFLVSYALRPVIFEEIDSHGDLVEGHRLAFNSFVEYVPYTS